MSHDDHNKEPIIPTSGARLGKGLIIVIATLAVGAGILIPFFDEMYSVPPPVTQIRTEQPEEPEEPAEAGTTTIAILQGSSVQGNPDYDPDQAQVPLGNKIVWDNQDTVPHTATSGTGPEDPDAAKLFDTGIIEDGAQSDPVELADAGEGDVVDYYCFVHPYMKAQLTIVAAEEGGATGGASGEGAAGGPTLNILEGAAVQGSPDYDPDPLTVTKGETINVVNQDALPHTVTSGASPSEADAGKAFDTSILEGGGTFKIETVNLDAGEYDYHCLVHPYMAGKFQVE